ncbi:hypothetical protein AX16_010548 [Volvariella volvacea WC 439]|nr:hypothetical protein AX16_010548 [Volvariella volvacea WC 439]
MHQPACVLPPELVRKVFYLASSDQPTKLTLLQLCKAAYTWLIPALYHSITLRTSRQITTFHALHNDDEYDPHDDIQWSHVIPKDIHNQQLTKRLALIHSLWIGDTRDRMSVQDVPTPSEFGATTTGAPPSDLRYGSSYWPITIIHRILFLLHKSYAEPKSPSPGLQSLTIINLTQDLWFRLTPCIPSSLQSLSIGPVHGPFHISQLFHQPNLKSFTSAATFMTDEQVEEVIGYPSIKKFRRISNVNTTSGRPIRAIEQFGGWLSKRGGSQPTTSTDGTSITSTPPPLSPSTLEQMELIVFGEKELINPLIQLLNFSRQGNLKDERLVVRGVSQPENWIDFLRQEFLDEEEAWLNSKS